MILLEERILDNSIFEFHVKVELVIIMTRNSNLTMIGIPNLIVIMISNLIVIRISNLIVIRMLLNSILIGIYLI